VIDKNHPEDRNTLNTGLFNSYTLVNHLRRNTKPVTVHEKVREWTNQEGTMFAPLHSNIKTSIRAKYSNHSAYLTSSSHSPSRLSQKSKPD